MMKVLSLFSGIGAFETALKRLGVDVELVGFSEIDKYAVKSYCAIHNVSESMNLGDITKVNAKALPRDIDLCTYGFPCQDISISGKQKGLFNEGGSLTRSGLFFEALRIIEATKPKVAIAENVKNLVSKKFNAQFQVVLASLAAAGYNNYYAVLNAKHYGVPQNRERVFIVSVRKDVDNRTFKFPESVPLVKRLKDVLEEVVDEKYYLSDKMIAGFMKHNDNHNAKGTGFLWKPKGEDDIANCLRANASLAPTDNTIVIKQVGQIYPNSGNPQAGRVYDADGISPTLDTCSGGNRMPKIVDPKIIKVGQLEGSYDQSGRVYSPDGISPTIMSNSHGKTSGGYTSPKVVVSEPTIQKIDIPQIVKVRKFLVNTEKLVSVLRDQKQKCGLTNKKIAEELDLPITTVEHYFRTDDCFAIPEPEVWGNLKRILKMDDIDEFDESIMTFEEKEGVYEKSERHYLSDGIAPTITSATAAEKIITPQERVRKLTPKECFRLMGFDDESFHKAEAVNSNSQLYKQAGNSIVVDVLEAIFRQMLDENGNFTI